MGRVPCLSPQTIPPIAEGSVVLGVGARSGVLPSSQHRLRPTAHNSHIGCARATVHAFGHTWRRAESCASAWASASASEPQDGASTVLSRELEQATGSAGNVDASFFAERVGGGGDSDGGGSGGCGGGCGCGCGGGGDGCGGGDNGGGGSSVESTRAAVSGVFVLVAGSVCIRTKSSADSRAIQTAQHTSALMLQRGSASRCLRGRGASILYSMINGIEYCKRYFATPCALAHDVRRIILTAIDTLALHWPSR